ncbi:ATP-dependent DNA helicase hus2/rqh1-like [Acropora millepora]|uniref:ATP-dependent DNA helicase hus2/rqh1-like n=1 Tax=Acropora millepora TaxID=45264 RepID=UPI001CF2F7E6|nr:ATP-dependent DNA helicase hus2/rqh1-like [Acropora millepora]
MLKISSQKAEQKQAVVGLLDGKDVMAILPTGFGKSLIFKLFTLVKMQEDGLTSLVIVWPLVSITEDQIKDFEDLGIYAAKLHCDEKMLEEIAAREHRVIFGSAKAVLDKRFRKVLRDDMKPFHSHVKLIDVDECHTVETWKGLFDQAFRGDSTSLPELLSFKFDRRFSNIG